MTVVLGARTSRVAVLGVFILAVGGCSGLIAGGPPAETRNQRYADGRRALADADAAIAAGDLGQAGLLIDQAKIRLRGSWLMTEVIETLDRLGLAFAGRDEPAAALSVFETARGLAQPPHDYKRQTYLLLSHIAHVHSSTGDLDVAIRYIREQLHFVETAVGPIRHSSGSWTGAGSRNVLASLLLDKGDYQEAIRYADDVYRGRHRLFPAEVTRALKARAFGRLWLGDPFAAEADLREALGIAEQRGLRDWLAGLWLDLAIVARVRGDYPEAAARVQRGIQLSRDAGQRSTLASGLVTAAVIEKALNQRQAARAHLDEGLGLLRTLRLQRELEYALRVKSSFHLAQGDYDTALTDVEESLRLAAARRSVRAQGFALCLMADIRAARGRDDLARAPYEQCLQHARAMKSEHLLVESALGLARLHLRAGTLEEAAHHLDAIAGLAARTRSSWARRAFYYQLGRLHEAQGRLEEAAAAYANAVAEIERVRGRLREPELRAAFVVDKQAMYEALVRVLLKLGRIPDAFQSMERARAAAFLDLLAERRLKPRASVEVPAGALAALEHAHEDVARLERGLAGQEATPDETTAVAAPRGNVLRTAEQRLSAAYEAFQGRLRVYEGQPAWTPIQLEQVRQHLGPDAAMVAYYVGRDDAWVVYADRDTVDARRLDVTPRALGEMVRSLRDAMIVGATEHSDGWRLPASRLHVGLLRAFDARLASKTQILLIPSGPLHYVPFAALLDSGGQPLLARLSISILPAATLLTLRETAGRRAAGMLAIANPAVPGLEPLPGAEAEVAALAQIERGEMLAGDSATKPAVTSRLAGRRVLHFATHGELNRAAPLRSNLRLTPIPPADDGRLTVDEIFDLDLSAELVVLSACDTGVGVRAAGETAAQQDTYDRLSPPGDEVVGLTRAFLYAGASSIVASLWPVEDDATAALMTRFYEGRRQSTTGAALRDAQRALMESGGPLSHPFFWAPFVLVGDGR